VARIGVFIERYTISSSGEMNALMRFSQVARRMGHDVDYLFRPDILKIPQYDAILIRALTDPLNTSYVAARIAELHRKPVIDDPDSIYICCDKVNMYRRLLDAGVPMPDTRFIYEEDLNLDQGSALLKELGKPLVLKAPNSSFSLYVERVQSADEFCKVGRRFLRRADALVVQRFLRSKFDWRVGLLNGEVLYVCQYTIPRKYWKIMTYNGHGQPEYGPVKAFDIHAVDPNLLKTAADAARAIGKGFYGVDLKQIDRDYLVIEVNDNPTIEAGEEDAKNPELYERIISYLVGPTP